MQDQEETERPRAEPNGLSHQYPSQRVDNPGPGRVPCMTFAPLRASMNTLNFSRPEAEALLPALLAATAASLRRGLTGLAASLPAGASNSDYERRRQSLSVPVAAHHALRLSVFQSAPDGLRTRAEELCQPRVAMLQQVLCVLLPHVAQGGLNYRRGDSERCARHLDASLAVSAWLSDPVQVARAVLGGPANPAFLSYAARFAVTDSHGHQGRADRIAAHEQELHLETLIHPSIDPRQEELLSAPGQAEELLGDNGDLLPLMVEQISSRFTAMFPLPRVPVTAEVALEFLQRYLTGMADVTGTHDTRQNGWGGLRLPRGRALEIANDFGLRVDQERRVRRAFEAAMDAQVAAYKQASKVAKWPAPDEDAPSSGRQPCTVPAPLRGQSRIRQRPP